MSTTLRARRLAVAVATSDSFLVRFWSAIAVLAPVAFLIWWLSG